jgi:subtilisin family serine protease
VLTVGATAQDGTVASFSSRGPTPDGQVKPDLVAPGVNILSALPHGTYGRFEGTSMATPHVAGVVALMWSANPKLIGDIADTTRILRQTATRVPEHASDVCGSPQDITGVGLVNAAAAVSAARTLIP